MLNRHIRFIPVYTPKKLLASIAGILFFFSNAFCQCAADNFKKAIERVYNSSGQNISNQLKHLQQIEKQMTLCNLGQDSAFIFLTQKIGILYFRLSDYAAAIVYATKAIRAADFCYSRHACSDVTLFDCYYNLYYYYGRSDELKKKLDVADSCIRYSLAGNTGFDLLIPVLEEKIEYLFNSGAYNSCTRYARLGEDILAMKPVKANLTDQVYFINIQANALYFNKNLYEAKKFLEEKIDTFEKNKNTEKIGALYNLMGLIDLDSRNFKKALLNFEKGYKSNSIIKFRKGCAESLIFTGITYARGFRNDAASLACLDHALQYSDASDSLLVFGQKGYIYSLMDKSDTAQYFFRKAFDIIKYGTDEKKLLEKTFAFQGTNILQKLSDLITVKGDDFVRQYRHKSEMNLLKQAIEVYKANDIFLDKIKRDQQLDFASNLVWRTTARNLYEHAIEACYMGDNSRDGFYFFEKGRAALLNDQVNEQRWENDSDIIKLAELKKNILNGEQKANGITPSSNEYLNIQKELYANNQRLAILENTLKAKNPAYFKNYVDTTFLSTSQLRHDVLGNSKSLIEIFYGDSSIYELVITPGKEYFRKIDKSLYDSLTQSYISLISNRYELNSHFRDFIKVSHSLYNLLFQQITLSGGSVIISPDGKSFPFEALAVNNDIQNPGYLLNHYAISYTYSANYLTNEFVENSGTSGNVFGIAPVQYNYAHLAPLTGSDHSLQNIDSYFGNTTSFTLDKATKNNFLRNFPSYSIVQLYTHASDTSAANDPVIYFSDSALYLSALLPDRKPVTQLVVLSACETANGKFYEGEGIFSFNRGFAAMGIPAAISTLWPVDNESTYAITELFYKYLSQGLPTDAALQKAKLEFISSHTSTEKTLPYFWAAPILTGKVDVIRMQQGFPWVKWSLITLSAALFLYIAILFAKRKIRITRQ